MFPQSPVFVQRAKRDLFPVQRAPGPAEPRIVSVLVCLVSEFFVSEVSFFYVQHKASRSIEHPKDQGRIDTLRNLCCQCCCYCGATNPARSPCGWPRLPVSLAPETLALAALCPEFVKLQTVPVTRAGLMPLLR